MALIAVDREILQRCLQHQSGAWNDFVDRFLGLIYHTIHYTAYLRSVPLTPAQVEDIAQEILMRLAADKYALLRQFRGNSSLATYLTVIARRITVRLLAKQAIARKPLPAELKAATAPVAAQTLETDSEEEEADISPTSRLGLESLERVQKLLRKLPTRERDVVRMYYLEGRTHEEISTELNIPVADINPILKRARKALRPQKPSSGLTPKPDAKKTEE